MGGAHIDPDATGEALREALIRHVTELRKFRPEKLVRRRAEKYAAMGAFTESLMPQTVEVRFKGTRKRFLPLAATRTEPLRLRRRSSSRSTAARTSAGCHAGGRRRARRKCACGVQGGVRGEADAPPGDKASAPKPRCPPSRAPTSSAPHEESRRLARRTPAAR